MARRGRRRGWHCRGGLREPLISHCIFHPLCFLFLLSANLCRTFSLQPVSCLVTALACFKVTALRYCCRRIKLESTAGYLLVIIIVGAIHPNSKQAKPEQYLSHVSYCCRVSAFFFRLLFANIRLSTIACYDRLSYYYRHFLGFALLCVALNTLISHANHTLRPRPWYHELFSEEGRGRKRGYWVPFRLLFPFSWIA